jgi:hypothetical protein
MARARQWLEQWLAAVRERRRDARTPPALRQCDWCQNGLHTRCTGWTPRADRRTVVDCLCPCARSTELRTRP